MERGDNKEYDYQSFAIAKDSASPPDLQRGDDADEDDNSTILNGAQAITGKAVYSANQAARNTDQIAAQHEKDNVDEAAEQARELRNLAVWNAQMTNVGGVQ